MEKAEISWFLTIWLFLPRLACLMRFVLLVELPPMFLGFFMIHQVSDYCALV